MNLLRLAPLLLAGPLCAGELTLETKPFRVEHRFDATVLPTEAPVLRLEPESWSSYVIETLAEHGKPVKKDELLVAFEREAYDRKLEDTERALEMKQLAVARQKLDFQKLKEENEIALEAARLAKEQAAADLEYFKTTGRPAAEARVEKSLVRAQFSLDSAKEELEQLKKMYDADDLTEETEEIILKRQKISVEMEEGDLQEAQRQAKRTLETELPRQLEAYERAARQAAIAFAKAEKNLPRTLETARLELAAAEAGLARDTTELERLRADGALLEWKAPADGIFFHGGLDEDAWDYGDLGKYLQVGTAVPIRRALASVAPAGARRLSARVDAATAAALEAGATVTLGLPGSTSDAPAGKITAIDPVPAPDGNYGLALTADWPEGQAPAVGTTVKCARVAHFLPEALVVPAKALIATAEGGWAVEVKLADGNTETRPVKRGISDGTSVQITEGLEPGQVVVTPE